MMAGSPSTSAPDDSEERKVFPFVSFPPVQHTTIDSSKHNEATRKRRRLQP
jgi:hypothetical protein